MAGETAGGQLKLAGHLFGYGSDFFPGPLTISGDASITPETSQAYDQVWSVRATEVELHRAYFACLNDPNCDITSAFPFGYTIPQGFIDWPAEGNISAGQAPYLAPFFDNDQDGSYEPFDGDHPCVPGDQALFSIFNNKLSAHTETNGQPIGVEVHMMPFAYESEDLALAQTVFIHYKIINRSTQDLHDFRMGFFMDPDLGCANDDFLGTDVGRSMFYVYNWDDVDEPCLGALGYGPQPPAFGMAVLTGPRMDADGSDNINEPLVPAFNGSGFDDGMIDNERYGLCNTMQWNREGAFAVSDPSIPAHFHGFLRSQWKDGTPQTYGGIGYDLDTGAIASNFLYPDDSDPFGVGTNGVPQSPWHETQQQPQDRRGVASMGPITFAPGDEQEILIAYVYARATSGGALASVTALQHRVDSIATFAATIPGIMAPGSPCDALPLSIAQHAKNTTALNVYPMPANDHATIVTSNQGTGRTIQILDAHGG